MTIRHGCFFSYAHGRHALMNRFKADLADAIRSYLEPHLDHEDELFIDSDFLGGGDDLDRRLARALCESVSMVVIYTPKYEAHEATRREFAAMQLLEQQRAAWAPLPSRLIIPIVMTRHPLELPPQITNPGFYLDFSGYTMASEDLKSNPEFLPHIAKLVDRIAVLYHHQKKHTPPAHDCNQFVLPTVTQPWRAVPDLSFPKI